GGGRSADRRPPRPPGAAGPAIAPVRPCGPTVPTVPRGRHTSAGSALPSPRRRPPRLPPARPGPGAGPGLPRRRPTPAVLPLGRTPIPRRDSWRSHEHLRQALPHLFGHRLLQGPLQALAFPRQLQAVGVWADVRPPPRQLSRGVHRHLSV